MVLLALFLLSQIKTPLAFTELTLFAPKGQGSRMSRFPPPENGSTASDEPLECGDSTPYSIRSSTMDLYLATTLLLGSFLWMVALFLDEDQPNGKGGVI